MGLRADLDISGGENSLSRARNLTANPRSASPQPRHLTVCNIKAHRTQLRGRLKSCVCVVRHGVPEISRMTSAVLGKDVNRWFQFRFPKSKLGRDSSVGIATVYGLDGPGIESQWGRNFPQSSRPALGPTQSPM